MKTRRMTRREALANLGALAGAAATAPLLGSCGGDSEPGEISNIVVVMMENRSYDHFLGARGFEGKPGDGLVAGMANPDLAGDPTAIYHESVACVADLSHGWNPSRAQLNGGACDGFVKSYQQRYAGALAHPMGYFTRQDLPVSWGLADAYTSCDRWFSSLLGPTWPNRLYLYAAQSGGAQGNSLPPEGRFTFPTILDRLDAAGIEWLYYYSDAPFIAILERVTSKNIKRIDVDFFDTAAAGKLPPVVIIDPAFSRNDDHPPHHPGLGQQFLAALYAALAASPQWKNLLLVVTYDEHGGFFDHVAPPTAADDRTAEGFDQLGFRVPTLVVGPYVKQGQVSSVVHDHTSVLRHIEGMFGLDPLTARDAAANDLSDAIDLDRLRRGDPRPAPAMPALELDESMFDPKCFGGALPSEIIVALDQGLIPRQLDGRHAVRDQLYLYGEVLDRFGAGRVRRGR